MLFSWTCDSEPTNLSQSNGDYLVKCLESYLFSTRNFILINCNDIKDIDDHFVDPLNKYLSNNKNVIFFSTDGKSVVVNHLITHLNKDIRNNAKHFSENNTESYCFVEGGLSNIQVKNIINDALILEISWLTKEIGYTYKKFDKETRLSSTPLIARGEFNAFMLISDSLKFRWVAILLAEKINRVIQDEMRSSYTIIAVSLRGAAIAGAVWEILYFLSGPKMHIVDHIGPRHDILETPSREPNIQLGDCIYIGDFLIAGTEAKIASAYCNFLSGRVRHAFVIGKYTKQNSLGNGVKLHSLVNLRDCSDDLYYSLD